ncbi:MAG TPA: adenylate/guanylate cyclase domain-containing protein, partial [Acidimicrobiales bacterium]|nr:adenylate/guanylate cyclase domain-containing protein [Acidimicrobiales bacterium]
MAHPSGTVTFLFSDVEGSTSMWERAPEVMAVAIERHEDLIRRAALAEAGYVFKTVGDAFCVAFSAGGNAARAAIEAQLALVAEPWPDETPIRVRMALHTGECQERNDDYFGPTVNRVARLLAVAHGGQVVASGTTASLLGDVDGLSLVDLG